MLGKFLRDETGAVTIDWVALTAGILLLGIAVVYGIFEGGVAQLAGSINENLSTAVERPGGIDTPPSVDTFSGTGTDTATGG
jgi:hypothetical protein